jgi:hypothetical protein
MAPWGKIPQYLVTIAIGTPPLVGILRFFPHKSAIHIKLHVSDILIFLGINPDIDWFPYLIETISLRIFEPGIIFAINWVGIVTIDIHRAFLVMNTTALIHDLYFQVMLSSAQITQVMISACVGLAPLIWVLGFLADKFPIYV